jgi:RNA-directed DNA polymerase
MSNEQKAYIQSTFQNLQNLQQFAELVQWVIDNLIHMPQLKRKFSVSSKVLNFYAFIKKDRYISFTISKKSGGERLISSPVFTLKLIQKAICQILTACYQPHPNAYGFIEQRSVVDNAKNHIGRSYIYNIDLDSFFPSTGFRKVKNTLALPPFNLTDAAEEINSKNKAVIKESKGRGFIGFLIANLCCENGGLPQGAPTSPILTNIVCQGLDRRLTIYAKKNKAHYTRYADDISFSSWENVFDGDFKEHLAEIIAKDHYRLNPEKERLQDRNVRQEVTGIVINRKPNVRREYIKDIRFWLNIWEKHHYERAQFVFVRCYIEKNGRSRNHIYRQAGKLPELSNYLSGKLNYLRMVKGVDDELYQNLLKRYFSINPVQTEPKEVYSESFKKLEYVINSIEDKGIDDAMTEFNTLFE